jgi:hypothetical protein
VSALWILDPSDPHDPTLGHWGVKQWRFFILLVDGVTNATGQPPADGRNAQDFRADLMAYIDLPALELKDVDEAVYVVKLTAYQDDQIAEFDIANPNGGWMAVIELAETTI